MSDSTERSLWERSCTACRGDEPPLFGEALKRFLGKLGPSWGLSSQVWLEKTYRFKDFKEALEGARSVGELAERENHHPVLEVGWGYLKVKVWTHKVGGLTENDFIFAAKTDLLLEKRAEKK